jgi:hypothetical protein
MEISSEIHVPAALPQGKESPYRVLNGQQCWSQRRSGRFGGDETTCLRWESNYNSSVVKPITYSKHQLLCVKSTVSVLEILNPLIIHKLIFCWNVLAALDLRVKALKLFYILHRTSPLSRTKIFFSTCESLRRGKKNKGSAEYVLQ